MNPMKEILEKIYNEPKKTIIVIGDLMLDKYIEGSVKRISPEAPVSIVHRNNDLVVLLML